MPRFRIAGLPLKIRCPKKFPPSSQPGERRASVWIFFFSQLIVLLFCFQSDVIHQSVFELIHTDDRALFRSQLHFAFNPTNSQQDGGCDSPSRLSVPVSHLCLCQGEWKKLKHTFPTRITKKTRCLNICALQSEHLTMTKQGSHTDEPLDAFPYE